MNRIIVLRETSPDGAASYYQWVVYASTDAVRADETSEPFANYRAAAAAARARATREPSMESWGF